MVEETRRSHSREATITALKGSIEKWHNILHADGEDKGDTNCALCGLFFCDGCVGCPIREKVGAAGCGKTPYMNWVEHQKGYHGIYHSYHVQCPTCRELAQAEYDFLKDLLIDYLSTRAKISDDYAPISLERWHEDIKSIPIAGKKEATVKSDIVYECPECGYRLNAWVIKDSGGTNESVGCPKCNIWNTVKRWRTTEKKSAGKNCSAIHRNWCQYKHHSQTKNALCSKYACMEEKPQVEKKEEWEDITKEIKWESKKMTHGWWVTGRYSNSHGRDLVEITGKEIILAYDDLDKNYKIESVDTGTSYEKFRILKRV